MRPAPFLARSLALASLGLSVLAARAQDFNGIWKWDLVKDSGAVVRSVFILHQDASGVTGTVIPNNAGILQIHDVRLKGPEVSFTSDWGWSFRMHRDGANLAFAVSYDGWRTEAKAVALPGSEADLRLPEKIPAPALVVLPPNGLALTPPMGWNSWNHFAESVDDRVVRETADAMVSSGMAAAGYTYVNIDDTWELNRDARGHIVPNRKFPDMKALAAYVHSKGLKIGIYSSPGFSTCGGYEGSYGHEEEDARTYADWGIDYLKYDWCSAGRIYPDSDLRAIYQRMGVALQRSGRPIVYSLCEYGMGDVWTWGPLAGGNLWRTTGDISDNYASMSANGFSQGRYAAYAAPGHWNDPDMLEVGNGGMTPVEYRTHFSLWCMLAAPLMAGNDLRSMDADTVAILTNREAIALDQDSLGRQATRIAARDGVETWVKPLADGGLAVGLFNRNARERDGSFSWAELGLAAAPHAVRDLWAHALVAPGPEGYRVRVAGHGVVLLRIK